jgi:hypothetical protein
VPLCPRTYTIKFPIGAPGVAIGAELPNAIRVLKCVGVFNLESRKGNTLHTSCLGLYKTGVGLQGYNLISVKYVYRFCKCKPRQPCCSGRCSWASPVGDVVRSTGHVPGGLNDVRALVRLSLFCRTTPKMIGPSRPPWDTPFWERNGRGGGGGWLLLPRS